ncbi:hypothetical protein ACH5RR_035291 [Cinchona calisaya]|uniref:CRAL-TRIO domain-containing protein n=1 Tax=Cinchona calisaya TaxID=153742 RepID=A0ABD2YHT1_9GENT
MSSKYTTTPSSLLSLPEQEKLIQKLQLFTIQGRDKRGSNVLCIIGKFFPARLVSVGALVKYLEEKIFPNLTDKPFSVVYVHTGVTRAENSPGISALRTIYHAIPIEVKDNLETVYFLHPGFPSRLFLATFGRLLFGGGLYGKLKYLNRLDFLWNNVRRKEIEIPEFVYNYDEEMECRSMMTMNYGLESDHPRARPRVFYNTTPPSVDDALPFYSMRCIA